MSAGTVISNAPSPVAQPGTASRDAQRDGTGQLRQRTNLPARPTAFVDREEITLSLAGRLRQPEVRLVTLIGTPGVGKTRIAIAVAADLLADFPEGVYFVDLAIIADPAHVVPHIASAVGMPEERSDSPLRQLQRFLSDRRVLLVLDNFEHVIASANEVSEILASCPNVKVLATSRETLRLAWEEVVRVLPLETPDRAEAASPEELEGYPAVNLFVLRARSVRSDFLLTEDNAAAVVEICRYLEGIPLAIELAAAQVDFLSAAQIARGLKISILGLAETRPRDLPARQSSLRTTLDWSYDLSSAEEQRVFRCLGIPVGSLSAELVEAVCRPDSPSPSPFFGTVASLVRKSLVATEVSATGEMRYRLREPVREYARARLEEAGEAEMVSERHALFLLSRTEEASRALAGQDQVQWLERMDRAYGNARAAVAFFRERGRVEEALRLATSLWRYWQLRGRYSEGQAFLESLLGLTTGDVPASLRARALVGAGELSRYTGDYACARAHLEEAASLSLQAGDRPTLAQALLMLGLCLTSEGDAEAARPRLEEAAAIARQNGDAYGQVMALNTLAMVAHSEANFRRQKELAGEALPLARALGNQWLHGAVIQQLGLAAIDEGELDEARKNLKDSLEMAMVVEDQWRIVYLVESFAALAAREGDCDRAMRLAGAAESARAFLKAPAPPLWQAILHRLLSPACSRLQSSRVAALQAEGQELDLEAAVREALEATRPRGDGAEVRLTPRERQVAALVAEGLSSAEIGTRLVISRRTAEGHVTSLLAKLGLSSRTQLALWAERHGYTPAE